MGKVLREKMNRFIFSLKTFSHETVINHSIAILLSGLRGLKRI